MMGVKLVVSALGAVAIAGQVFADFAQATVARKSPDWFTKGVMVQIQPRAFTAEGTLKAAEKRLKYLKDSGFTIVYLVPVFKMDADMDQTFWSPRQIKSGFGNPKNQYRMADYNHVDEEYGTDQDLKDFCAKAHELGLYVIFDLVYLHCGPTAPFLKEHPEFTYWNDDGTVKKGPWRFPKLNFQQEGLRKFLLANMRNLLLQFGCDGFRCDVGDGIPIDFWCEAHDMTDAVTAGHAIMLCEGSCSVNQQKGFDADYGWFPCEVWKKDGTFDAGVIRRRWEGNVSTRPAGARYVNHYENHDIATDHRPRRELALGHEAVDQINVWMLTADGIPMLFNGNEFAEASPDHSMFGKTPLDWAALETPAGKYRHELVRRLSDLRRMHPAFTSAQGRPGMTWFNTSRPDEVTAFARRGGGETMFVVQNWTPGELEVTVDFNVPKSEKVSYIVVEEPDRSLRGVFAAQPLLERRAEKTGNDSFRLGAYGFAVFEVKE